MNSAPAQQNPLSATIHLAVQHVLEAIKDREGAFSVLERCLTLKEKGFRSEAYDLLQAAAAAYPGEANFRFESAVLLIGRAKLDESVRELEQSVAINPRHESATLALCLMYVLKRRDDQAVELLRGAAADKIFGASALLSLMIDLREDEPDSIAMIGSAKDTNWLDAKRVGGGICRAITQRSPYAVIRLGDGEGSMFRMRSEYELAHSRLLHDARTHFTNRWYSEPYQACRWPIDMITRELMANLARADVIGMPDDGWIRHEFATVNPRGLMACLNARRVGEAAAVLGAAKARTSIHYELLQERWIATILDQLTEVAVVSCHAEVKQLLEQTRPGLSVQMACLPPAFSDLSVTGLSFTSPAYKQIDVILNMLDLERPGTVVLIGAGFIGKLLALRLKQMGHIALDVGSLFDLLLGFRTRGTLKIFHEESEKVRSWLFHAA